MTGVDMVIPAKFIVAGDLLRVTESTDYATVTGVQTVNGVTTVLYTYAYFGKPNQSRASIPSNATVSIWR